MKILDSQQLKTVDSETIKCQRITSVELMERAALVCSEKLSKYINKDSTVWIFCGMGNNGGDGLVIARLLFERGIQVQVVVINYSEDFSNDANVNLQRLPQQTQTSLINIHQERDLKAIEIGSNALIIDAILGTGANRLPSGILKETIDYLNHLSNYKISIDVPSGLMTNISMKTNLNLCFHPNLVMTFQVPKMGFLLAENEIAVPQFEILDIQLDKNIIEEQESNLFYLEKEDVASLLMPRKKFSHKGTYGHALLFAGSKGKAGAAIMASEACLRSGAGLLTLHSTKSVIEALNFRLPEAMSEEDENEEYISDFSNKINTNAIGFGPGVGKTSETAKVLKKIIQNFTGKLIIDADGLNILAENKTWLEFLLPQTILTPHPKEFERLFGTFDNDFERIKRAKEIAQSRNIILILKGAHTAICLPNGNIFFNSTGNPCLAKGGSGDVLTGIILGLLARGYAPSAASIIGVYIHGLAADLCTENKSMESIIASDLIKKLPEAFQLLQER